MSNNSLPIRIVCATRETPEGFLTRTATGSSIRAFLNISNAELCLFAQNTTGLSEIYNKAIEESRQNPAILVFIHDDILVTDFFWAERIRAGLNLFDVIGLAGNKRRCPRQPSWAFINENFQWDDSKNLSGAVGHGKGVFPVEVSQFGPSLQECKLLDGLLLAVKSESLIKSEVRFDEIFKFHFYDLDFCRSLEMAGLRMGTIPLSVVHESGGAFGSESWSLSYGVYLEKWGG